MPSHVVIYCMKKRYFNKISYLIFAGLEKELGKDLFADYGEKPIVGDYLHLY